MQSCISGRYKCWLTAGCRKPSSNYKTIYYVKVLVEKLAVIARFFTESVYGLEPSSSGSWPSLPACANPKGRSGYCPRSLQNGQLGSESIPVKNQRNSKERFWWASKISKEFSTDENLSWARTIGIIYAASSQRLCSVPNESFPAIPGDRIWEFLRAK